MLHPSLPSSLVNLRSVQQPISWLCFLWNLPQRLRPHFSELWCPRSTLKSHLTSYYKILRTGWEISVLIRWHYNDRQEEKITWIFNIFAKHFCNEEMEKLALQFSEVSEEEKIWGWFGSIASFTSFWQTPGPVRSHVPCPGCHFSPEVSAFEPRTTIYIYIKKCKIPLFYIFNKKGFSNISWI